MKEESIPIESNISFADASLKSFKFEEENRTLNIFLESWDEKKVKLVFGYVLYFEYKPGDFISEIYNTISENILLNDSLIREYSKIPENHSYKLIEIKDIDDISICKIVCNEISISID